MNYFTFKRKPVKSCRCHKKINLFYLILFYFESEILFYFVIEILFYFGIEILFYFVAKILFYLEILILFFFSKSRLCFILKVRLKFISKPRFCFIWQFRFCFVFLKSKLALVGHDMNQTCRKIRKTTKLKCSLKQKNKIGTQIKITIIFLDVLLPSLF